MRLTYAFVVLMTFASLAATAADFPKPAQTKPDEPVAKEFSATKAAEYLDGVGVNWTRLRKCITCHTNMPYLTARPLLPGDDGWKEVREFLEDDVDAWSKGRSRAATPTSSPPPSPSPSTTPKSPARSTQQHERLSIACSKCSSRPANGSG